MSVFNILPLIIELTFVLVIIFVLYPVIFFTITGVSIVLYITATVTITEWRAKYFKRLA
jgi:ABC-type transport system involved in Fe-S cluster assembly fused permease/ATPase subunit